MRDPAELTLKEVAVAIRRRKLSSLELTRSLIARIERWQKLNAFVRIETEEALSAAKAADRALARRGPKGPLHGVPLAHKDMYYSAGKPAACGSKLRQGWIAPVNSTVIARLESAGSFRLGALRVAEFAYGPTGHNSHLGPARNPWDLSASPAARRRAPALRLAHASCTPRLVRIPEARSGCRRIFAALPVSSRQMDA